MKVIFLDIDGVIKPARSYFLDDEGFDKISISIVDKIAERCDAVVVINSTWGIVLSDKDVFDKFVNDSGLKTKISGITTYPNAPNRLDAIRKFCEENNVTEWVALDDYEIRDVRAIQVNGENGLSVQNYRDATRILGNYDNFVCLV